MTIVRRLIPALAAILIAVFTADAPSPASAAARAGSVHATSYDSHQHFVPVTYTVIERGPPSSADEHPSSGAVDRWSHGTVAWPEAATPDVSTPFNNLTKLVPVAQATSPTAGQAPGVDGSSLFVASLGVAAKACSFAGTTVVLMADGTKKPIEDIEVGDKVIATDPETGDPVAKTVEHVFVHHDTVIDLGVDGEVITTTEDHPFWSVTDQRFERADQLAAGEQVLNADSQLITVSGLRLGTARQALAYNLSVEGIHTYHVGGSEILVHNTNRACDVPLPSQVMGKTTPLTTSQASDLARYLGYSRTNFLVKGERVFQRGGSYIVQDTTAHSGGVWKIATTVKALGSKNTRTATTDALLNEIGR